MFRRRIFGIACRAIIADLSGAMIEAGSETTSAMLNNAIIGLLSNPSTIDAAHEELDRVVGSDRPPNFDDEKDLPYIRGIIKVRYHLTQLTQELLRWRPINKFGNNHCVTQDDWYNGFFIPKGSVIMANWWAIHYDERYYSDPFTVPHLADRLTVIVQSCTIP
jgi:cytochrome P450